MAVNKRNITMDFLRGISAVIVCAGHLRAVMFVDFVDLKSGSFLDQLFYFLTSLGHEAVMVFFVLSGFFVGGSVISKRLKFKFDNYLIARLSRLWTVLIPALIFTLLVDLIIGWLNPAVLSGHYYSILLSGPSDSYSASVLTFLSNITFLQTVYSPVFGSNGPLWSLANEFWYYMLFPLMMVSLGFMKSSIKKRLLAICLLAVVIYFVAIGLMDGYLIWLMGVPVYLIYSRNLLNLGSWFTISTFILFLASLINSKIEFLTGIIPLSSDIVVGTSFSLFLISLRRIESTVWVKKYLSKISFWLSDISYTLYVFHFPVMILVYTIFYQKEQRVLNASSLFEYLFWLLVIVLLSRVLWLIFENNTSSVRTQFFKLRDLFAKNKN